MIVHTRHTWSLYRSTPHSFRLSSYTLCDHKDHLQLAPPLDASNFSHASKMDALFGGRGAAGDAALGQFPLEQWFFEMPVCTRWWTTATILTGVLVQCHIITPFQLFYSFRAVFHKSQVGLDLWILSKVADKSRVLTWDHNSTGDSLPHSSTSAHYRSTLSFTSSSSNDTRECSKSQRSVRHTSHG